METCYDAVVGMGYLLSYKDNLKKLKDQAEKLNNIKEQIIEGNRRDGRSREYNVQEWLETFDEISEAAKKLRAEHESDANALCAPNLKLKSRYERGQKAKRLVEILDELEELVPLHANLNYASEKLESRNSMKEDIVAALKQCSATKIGIYGLAGMGKTHLASEVAKWGQDDKLFDAVVQTSVAQSVNVEAIQRDIAYRLKLQLEETPTVVSTASRINERIKSKKSVLIMLDDMWQNIDLPSLGIPLPDNNYKACKLLLISRDRHVLEKNGTEKNFKLDLLNDEEARSLFLIKASEDGVKDTNLRNIANQVALRCAGLPLAIVKMAQLYKEKMSLNESDYEKMKEKICLSVETSYNKLEDEVKKVFLLCGAHGTPLLIGDLLKYVIGLGIFGHEGSIEDTRNKLKRTINELKESSLLLDYSAREVKVNALIYNVAASIASKHHPHHQVFTRNWPGNDDFGRCSHIILKCCLIQELPARLDCPNLNFLYLDTTDNSTLEIPGTFFEGMGNLQVLDLIGITIPSLPASLVFLTKLKTLCLRQCHLKDMVGIGALESLEILSFFQSSMNEFLDEIGQLTHLRMLDLSYSTIEVIPPDIMSKLTRLEELYVGKAEISAKQNKKEILTTLGLLTSLTALEIHIHEDWILPSSKIFEKLKRFNIVIGDGWEWSDSNGTSRLLKLKLHTNIHLQELNTLINRVEDLYLDEIDGISNNVLCELNDEGFRQVRKLYIQNNTKIEQVVKSRERNQNPAAWFPNLGTMILVNLSNLKEIYDGPLATVHSFENLKFIKVQRCGQLQYLFPASMIKQVSELVEIEVYECSSMKTIVSLDNGSYNDLVEFSSLDSLTLQDLPGINGFCSHVDHKSVNLLLFSNPKDPLPRLKHLKLIRVSLIMHLATWTILDAQQNLETLQIEGCSELRSLFYIEGYKIHDSFGGLLPKIQQLSLLNLDSFKSIVTFKHPERILNLQRLNHLTLCSCKQLKYILPLYLLKNLQQLQNVDVSDCNNLEQLFGDEKDKQMTESKETMLPLLRSLKLTNLPMLLSICSGDRHIISRSLTQMTVENCPKFTFTFSEYLIRIKEKDPSDQSSIELIYPHFLENLKLEGLNHLKRLSKDRLVSFMHLTSLQLYECDKLEYLFQVGVARGLSSLQELNIALCKNVEQILSRETEGKASTNDIVEFPEVKTLILVDLPRLTGFCHGCTIRWLSLKKVTVIGCPKIQHSKLGTVDRPLLDSVEVIRCHPWKTKDLETDIFYLFHLTDETSQLVYLKVDNSKQLKKYLDMNLQRSSFRQVKNLKASQCDTELCKLVSLLLRRSYKLEKLTVGKCEELEQVFDLGEFVAEDQTNLRFPNLKEIRLFGLPKLNCIWNKEPRGIVELGKLVKLEIIECGLHKSPISPALLEELVLLEELKIESCQMIKHVVEEDEQMQDIVFTKLRILQLVNLQELIKFNSGHSNIRFPNLQSLTIDKCPKMNAFTTGFLCKQTPTIEGTSYHALQVQMEDTYAKLRKLKLVGHEALEEIWQGWASAHIPVSELKDVEVDSLSSVSYIFSTNMLPRLDKLARLVVRNCSSLNYVFRLSKRDSFIAFQRLVIVRIKNCGSLRCLSIPSSCRLLKEIQISNCNAFKEIFLDSEEEEEEEDTAEKSFPYLKSIVLENLPQLSCFSSKTFEFPSLQKVRIVNCPAMKTLCSQVSAPSDNFFMDMNSLPGDQPVELEWRGLLNKQLWKQEPDFPVWKNLTSLKIVRCRSIKTLFSLSVAEQLAVLKGLKLQECDSMVQALGGDEGNVKQVLLQLESLVLKHMPNLTSFCEKDVEFGFPKLKMVKVEKIPQMKTFVRGSLKTPNLNQVCATYVTKCWQGDLNETIKYLHENHDKFDANVWVTSKNPHRNISFSRWKDAAESSSEEMTKTSSRVMYEEAPESE